MSNVFALTQAGYRFGSDDGSEAAHTLLGTQSLPLAIDVSGGNVDRILRILLNETGAGSISGATTDDYQLQVSKNGAAFANVTTSSTNVLAYNSSNLTDAGTTTERVTGGSGSFVAGEISEDGLVDDRQITANNHSEMVYTVRFVAADLAENDVLTFRVLLNGATTNMTYTVTPTAAIAVHRAPAVKAFALAGTLVALAFIGPSTGSMAFTGVAPTVTIGEASPTYAPAAGALAFTGTTPSLGFTIPIDTGALAFTGTTPAGNVGLSFAPDVGALTLSGTTPSLGLTYPISAGSLAFTGPAPTVSTIIGGYPVAEGTLTLAGYGVGIAFQGPSTGSLAFTGVAPTLAIGQDATVSPAAGSLAFSGTYVDIAFKGPDEGTLVFTGYAPTVINIPRTRFPLVGTLALSGTTPVVQKGIPIGSVAIAFTGTTPIVQKGILEPVGTLSFTGQSVAVGQGVVPSAASLAFTGTVPALVYAGFQAPAEGALVLTGTTPVLALTLPVADGALTFTGTIPGVNIAGEPATTIPVQSAVLTLTGTTLSMGLGYLPSAGSLTLTGQTPAVPFGLLSQPATGTLVLTGQTPTNTSQIRIGVAALTLEGQSLSVGNGYGIPVGPLVLTGTVPTAALGGTNLTLATPDYVIVVRADPGEIVVSADVGVILVRAGGTE